MTTLFWVLAVTLAASFLCSILEAVFLSVTHSHIALLKNEGEWAGSWLENARRNVEEPIAAILTLNTIAHTVGATFGGALALQVFGSTWVAAFSAALTFVILVFTEILPKTLGATYWQKLAKPSAYVLRGMIVVMKPLLVPLSWMSRLLTPKTERPTISRTELEVLAEIGRREGTLDEDEWKVVTNVIRLGEVSIGEVMTPRTDMVAIPHTATVQEAAEVMLETGHLRLPVYQGSVDSIVGVVIGRDVWKAHRDGITDLSAVMRPAQFAPASKAVEDLIPEMRQQRIKIAIVVDEFGGTAGLVTLEDLIEEIIGEIQDEHEADEPVDFQPLYGGRLRVWGGTTLREATEVLGFEPTPDELEGYDSLGGFIFGRLNRIASIGDEVDVGSGVLRVTHMRGRRIEYLLFIPRAREDGEAPAGEKERGNDKERKKR
ncbi:MAG TPA: hemolysin family protein [Longimicrobiales bacterium]|nr:hemolysin family protein [Longimicrobiales bacterium]